MARVYLDRPTPVRDEAESSARIVALVTGLLPALIGAGVVTAVQGELVLGLLGLLLGLPGAVAAWWASVRTASRSEPQVTPLSDPRDNEDRRLVPASPETDAPWKH
jgi:hypothetical protein